jgi:hypothetical protein
MYDMLPFPNITATDTKEQVAQINNYLIQFKETLEFILTNISADNLSADLIAKLNSLGSDIQKENVERGEEMQQVSGRIITASDVVNSAVYQMDMELREEQIQKAHEADINAVNRQIQQLSNTEQADKDALTAQIQQVSNTHTADINAVREEIEAVSDAHAVDKSALESQIQDVSNTQQADKSALEKQIQQVSSTQQADKSALEGQINSLSSTQQADKTALETQISNVSKAHQADIDAVNAEIQSVSDRVLTIPEIINSEEYQADMDVMEAEIQKNVEAKVPTASDVVNAMDLRVNFDTGHLEY